jgi:hypothetical protein
LVEAGVRQASLVAAVLLVGACVFGLARAAAGFNPHPIHPQIAWTASRKLISRSGCRANYLYTVRITGSTEYLNEHIQTYPGTYYAGQKAVVELFGPDYPSHPRQTKIIRQDGTFTVSYPTHSCASKTKAGVAMVSVGRFLGMLPSLASTVS